MNENAKDREPADAPIHFVPVTPRKRRPSRPVRIVKKPKVQLGAWPFGPTPSS
jgi:hypothetical protein